MHALRGLPHVIDLRNAGLLAGIELEPRPGQSGARAFELFVDCFNRGTLVRAAGDTICLSPPLIIERGQIDQLFGTLESALRALA